MRISITIPDELHDQLKESSADKTPNGVNARIVALLDRFKDHSLSDRWLMIPPQARMQLEEMLQVAALTKPEDLLDRVRRNCTLKLHDISLRYGSGALEEMKRRADRVGVPFEEYLQQAVHASERYLSAAI